MFRTAFRNAGRRFYHSVDHPTSNDIINTASIEAKVLGKALDYLPKYGFDELCITQSVRDLGYSDSLESLLTANGTSLEVQLMMFWLKSQRARLQNEVLDTASPLHKLTSQYERTKYLINKRLDYNKPIVHHLSSGLAQLVVPYNLPLALDELHSLSDDICFYLGDTSNDFAWYSKRAGVLTVYVSAELYMLQDTSEGFEKTREFVNNKVDGLDKLGDSYNDVEQWGFFTGVSLINLIKSQLARG